MTDTERARIEIVKAMLDEFPKLRAWIKAYLKWYY